MMRKDVFIFGQLCLMAFAALTSGFPNITIFNATGPFIFDANKSSEVLFSVEDTGEGNLTYTVFVNHKGLGENVSRLKCYLKSTTQSCSFSSKDCECLDKKPGHHQYRLKKVFQREDSGDWTFSILGKGLSLSKSLNITVVSHSPQATEPAISSTAETVQSLGSPPSSTMTNNVSRGLADGSLRGATEAHPNNLDIDADCTRGCDRIFLVVVITCVAILIVICVACVLLIISVRYFLNRFAWEHRHCLLSTQEFGMHADSLCELLPDRLQAETSFRRGRYYAYRRKRRRSPARDDGGDDISYMCIDDDSVHDSYLTPVADALRENAAD